MIDHVEDFLFEGEHVLVGEDGSPFFDPLKDVSFYVNERVWVNNHIHIVRPDQSRVLGRFLVHSFNIVNYSEFISGTTRDKLTQGQLNDIRHPVPPLHEQKEIVSFLDEKTGWIDDEVSSEEKSISLLKELRQSLISEVVTGKIDVRKERVDEVH